MLAQRAVADSPRWTRAVEGRSAPITGEITSERGRIIYIVRRAQLRIDQATLEKEIENWKDACALDHPSRPFVEATMVVRCGLLGTRRVLDFGELSRGARQGWVGEKRTEVLSILRRMWR